MNVLVELTSVTLQDGARDLRRRDERSGLPRDIGTRGVGLSLNSSAQLHALVLAEFDRPPGPSDPERWCSAAAGSGMATPSYAAGGEFRSGPCSKSRPGPVSTGLTTSRRIRIDGKRVGANALAGTMLLAQTQRATAAWGSRGLPLPPECFHEELWQTTDAPLRHRR